MVSAQSGLTIMLSFESTISKLFLFLDHDMVTFSLEEVIVLPGLANVAKYVILVRIKRKILREGTHDEELPACHGK
jgi:hypothetical protein